MLSSRKNSEKYTIIIPARLGSSRLPGKMLADLGGKPLIQRTYENALSFGAEQVVIATDHESIYQAAQGFGARVCMTGPEHENGTARLAEAVNLLGLLDDHIVLNIQGDEPFASKDIGLNLVNSLSNAKNPEAQMATAVLPIKDPAQIFEPSIVKVLRNKLGFATYFSRAPIPWDRNGLIQTQTPEQFLLQQPIYYRHIGIYAYRVETLAAYAGLEPSPWEKIESLEQLRFIWHDYKVYAAIIDLELPLGIDTEQDLINARQYLL
ncbi:MAG: 3-deoxy-manno-octulosonate cytidylyltransferase [Gammaproteobacteria bacterium]